MSGAIMVAGGEPLTQVIVEELLLKGAEVVVIAEARSRSDVLRELGRCGARIVEGSPCAATDLTDAGLEHAGVLMLTADDDAGNVDAILAARRLRGDLPIVARVFDPALSAYVQDTVSGVTVLSMSAIAAPIIVETVLREAAQRPQPPYSRRTRSRTAHRRGRLDRVLAGAGILWILLVAVSTLFFAHALDLRWIDALYFVWTTIFTVGYGDISLAKASDTAKIAGMLLMLAGAALVAVLYALLTGWVIAQRLDVLRGRVPVRKRGHYVIAGAGNLGYRVALALGQRGCSVVVIEKSAEERRVNELRAAGHHVIVADALADDTLALTNIEACAAALALTDSDATNLELALKMRARQPDVPLIVRLASRELSSHLAQRADAIPTSPLLLAGRAFVDAALAAQSRARSSDIGVIAPHPHPTLPPEGEGVL
jgi:Trk K+ transport system NAD-binding subunit/multidrug transporter EmrE-like cation transporter